MNKDELIVEYTRLCLQFVGFTGSEPVNEDEYNYVTKRLNQIRNLVGLNTIDF